MSISAPQVSAELGRVAYLVRRAGRVSRSELARQVGVSRTALAARLDVLRELHLIEDIAPTTSDGGRPPALLRFAADGGCIVGIDLGATGVSVAVTDLDATPLTFVSEDLDVRDGPDAVLAAIAAIVDRALTQDPSWTTRLKGIGIGVPGPVEFATGRPVAPPIMPGWDQFPVREFFEDRYRRPVFVDNDVNLMAQGERWSGRAADVENSLWVKIGSGIGCGLIVAGQIYRGSDGSAGDIGHVQSTSGEQVCRCGNRGCLEAVAGGFALGAAARELAESGRSNVLAGILAANGTISAADLLTSVEKGDVASVELVRAAGQAIGDVLAAMVNFFNPELVVVGGGVANVGDLLLASIREAIYRRSLPLATRRLVIRNSELGAEVGVIGAAALVLDELYRLGRLAPTA